MAADLNRRIKILSPEGLQIYIAQILHVNLLNDNYYIKDFMILMIVFCCI